MLKFEEFIRTPRCKPLVLADEDQPQDPRDWKKLEKQHQETQYAKYCLQFEPEERLHNTLQNGTDPVLRKQKWNEYMRAYRKKPKFCPHCKKQI
jgi:hypothetical protein